MTTPPGSVVITGCSTGIGECAALRLDRLGWRVFAGVRRAEDGRRLAEKASHQLRWILLDVTDEDSIAAATAQVAEAVGSNGLQGLVNNAGIAVGGPIEGVPLDQLRWQFEVNVIGLVAVTQAMIPLLRPAQGRIVNIGSIAGRVTSPIVGAYCASKHAVEAVTDALRLELGPSGMYASVIEPGVILTPIWDKALAKSGSALSAEVAQRYSAEVTLIVKTARRARKHGIPADRVADVIVHALSATRPRHRYVVGRDARIRLALQTILPRRWMDALVHRVVRKYGQPRT